MAGLRFCHQTERRTEMGKLLRFLPLALMAWRYMKRRKGYRRAY